MKKKLLFGSSALAVAIVSALVLSAGGSPTHAAEPAAAKPAPEVTVAQVLLRPVSDANAFTGRIQAVDTIQIKPRVSGYVDTVHFREGATVKKGDLLFTIDPRPYRAESDRLAANLAQARAEAKNADANAARGSKLVQQHAVSQEEADRLDTAAASAKAQVASVQAALDNARLNLSFTEVRAPVDGKVSNAQITAGNLVTPTDTLTSVVTVDPMYVYFDVDEQTFLKLDRLRRANGHAPDVEMGLADEQGYPHVGKIDFVDNQIRAGAGTIRLRAVFPNTDGAYTAGLFARVELRSGNTQPRALIDDKAVGTDLGNKFVYVVGKDKKVEYRRVSTGALVDGLRVVDSGLNAEDVVVVNGLQRVRPGVEVNAKRVAMASLVPESARNVAAARPAGVDSVAQNQD
ncbi:efflux transporter periplasmic adaptor subunit [Luteibacter rhizovicinus DSM 16549]|uniref:Efflux transporter periplasmic adaptor subunit n=1 Tax=Luteibacter rhizovicinus DSM 16549 TaxID=1440763 RepID=A0A0G9HM80_9GAMM|nr:efflux RND transporter periplasmic adaptor subunit [Luteibacter rhizovicinus]APG03614.1 efflux transporter periplasmic adaptor subunit [Luteibacter rhizovicinus DSM 16549]KLD68777.1 RND transporter MFP subunit [Luteibacter rhizovicinus DSM 16549]KLD73248.1 RND transporter MFP subunit [Xanthomonas hyacinthi DSM 19077]